MCRTESMSKGERYGLKVLMDNELLEIIIGTRENIDYANEALRNLTIPELIASGLTRSEALKLASVWEYADRLWAEKCEGNKLNCASDIAQKYMQEMRKYEQEHFKVIMLTNSNKLITDEDMTVGTSDSSLVSIREVMRKALLCNASKIVLMHNHPSGSTAMPSEADIDVTKRVDEACKYMGLSLTDHIIIAQSGYCSLREQGVIE